jgi:hypothetical protein
VADDPPFLDLVGRVRHASLDSLEHQSYAYEEYERRVPAPARFRFESWGGPLHLPGLVSERFELGPEPMVQWTPEPYPEASVPELLLAEHADGGLDGRLFFNRLALERATVASLAEDLLVVTRRACERPDERLSRLSRAGWARASTSTARELVSHV